MTKRILAILAALALFAGACGNDDDTDVSTPTDGQEQPADGEAQNITVEVDNVTDGANVAFLQYFPAEVSVRAGDTIDFAFQEGDPHTVTFGSLVDEALAAGPEAEGPPPIPFAFDEANNVNQAAAQPCYLEAGGQLPAEGACDVQEQPAFSGGQAFYNSGLAVPGDTFSVEVAADAAEGTYSYICLLHGPEMGGTVTVVGADADVPSADEVEAAGQAELDEAASALADEIAGLDEGTVPAFEGVFETGPNFLVAGSGDPEVFADILAFGPAEVDIAAGDTLTWNLVGFHTISFNAPQDATPPITPNAEGDLAANPLAFAPQGGWPGAPPPPEGGGEGEGEGGGEPEGPPPPPTNIDAGEWDGTGFVSSGALPSFPPALFSYSVTFTQAGTYTYACLIHEDMEGTVNVT